MINPCLNNLVGVSRCGQPTTAYIDLMRAPEITNKALAKTATDKYTTGFNLAQSMIDNAQTDIIDDLIGRMKINNMIADLTEISYSTGYFHQGTTILPPLPDDITKRPGQILRKVSQRRGSIKRMQITQLELYPVDNAPDAEVHIVDGAERTVYKIALTGGYVNKLKLAIPYRVNSEIVSVLIWSPGTRFYSNELICLKGCDGNAPNNCAMSASFNGTTEVRGKEGNGLNVIFECSCDFSALFCDFAKSHLANLIYLKSRMLLLQERIYGDRMNDFIVFGIDEAKELYTLLLSDYTTGMDALFAALPQYLQRIADDCILCRGIGWQPNG